MPTSLRLIRQQLTNIFGGIPKSISNCSNSLLPPERLWKLGGVVSLVQLVTLALAPQRGDVDTEVFCRILERG